MTKLADLKTAFLSDPDNKGPCCINHRTSAEYPYP